MMAGTPRIMVFDRLDRYLFDVDPERLTEATYVEEINGENSLTLTTTQRLEKTHRLVTRDAMGTWREYVVTGIEETHDSFEYYCVWSLQYDLSATFINGPYDCGVVPGHASIPQSPHVAMGVALGDTTRWTVGVITNPTMAAASFYRRSGWEGIETVLERWGGELRANIEVDANGVTARTVDLLEHLGSEDATRRFDYGHDLTDIKRTVSDDVWPCRIVPLGKSQETEAGGYTRRPDISSVNGGVMWLQDGSVVDLVKVMNPQGEWEYPTAIVRNDTYEAPADLKAWATEHISDYTRPQISYEASVLQFEQAGMNAHGVALGDNVVVVDRDFALGDGLRINARVTRIRGSLTDPTDIELTIGNATEGLSGQFSSTATALDQLQTRVDRSDDWRATATYVSDLINRLNQSINATGGYSYITEGEGFVTYDRPVSDPLVGAEATKVVEVRGGNIRIADSRTPGGDWDWKTLIQSGHIAANLVTAVNVTAGFIGNASGGSYWDLDGGILHISDGSYIGTVPVEDVITLFNEAITDVDVEYAQNQSRTTAPTTGWSTVAPAWREGYYIWQRTATTNDGGTVYSQPTCISGSDGQKGDPGTSVTILGSYNSYADLVAAHPTGSAGDAYMVDGDLYVWNGSAWEDVGQIQGPPGQNGAPGTSVTVTSIQYGVSNSASAEPSTWSTTPPTSIQAGKWLWVKTNYNVGSPAITKSYVGTNGTNGTSVAIQSATKTGGTTTVVLVDGSGTQTLTIDDGEDGATGTPGLNGKNIHTAWANSADGTLDFSTTVSAGKKYLGTYADRSETDSQLPGSYDWSLIKGADGQNGAPGQDGADGVGISAIVEEYYLSTSSSSPVGGSWSTTQPQWRDGTYIWTRSKITWDTVPATTTTTTPVLAQALTMANYNASEANVTVTQLNQYLRFVPSDGLYVGKEGTTARSLMSSSGFEVMDTSDDRFVHIGTGYANISGDPYYLFGPDAENYEGALGGGGGEGDGIIIVDDDIQPIPDEDLVGANSFSVGENNVPTGTMSMAHGGANTTSGDRSFASGYGNTASGNNSFATGNNNTASGGNSVALGYNNTAGSSQSVAMGSGCSVTGGRSIASGTGNSVTAWDCAAFGDTNTVSGENSFAAGDHNKATALNCFVANSNNTASGTSATAFGDNCVASGNRSFVLGSENKATGVASFAMGYKCEANGGFSFAGGDACKAGDSGASGFAFGYNCNVNNSSAVAFGQGNTTNATGQFVCGSYASPTSTDKFLVGGGISSSRVNAFRVTNGGASYTRGTCYAAAFQQTSDRRLKEHVAFLDDLETELDACEFVRNLAPVLFTLKSDGTRHTGFYAQDVQAAEPDGWDTDTVTVGSAMEEHAEFDPLTLDYSALIAPLVTYCHHLERRIEDLEEKVNTLTTGGSL